MNQQLLDWVNALTPSPANLALLQACATGVGVADTGTFGVLKTRVRNRVATFTMTAPAMWTPPGGFPPPPPIVGVPPVIDVPLAPLVLTEGTPFSRIMTATGGTAPLSWTAVGLPPGLTIPNPANGEIVGTATANGTFTAQVTVADSATPSLRDTQTITFNVTAAAPPPPPPIAPLAITTTRMRTGRRTRPYTMVMTATGGTAPYTWILNAGPAWAEIDSVTGTITGTPPRFGRVDQNFEIEVEDSVGTPPANVDLPITITSAPSLNLSRFMVPAAVVAAILLFGILAWTLIDRATDDDGNTPAGPGGTQTQVPGGTQTQVPGTTVGLDPKGTHFPRLEKLDPSFRSGGFLPWLNAAGVSCQAVQQARQPEEETNPNTGKISVAGIQVSATSCHVAWPAIVTTDTPSRVISKDSNSVQYQPDPNNGSTLYTNVTVDGPVTIWADGTNWGQFTSKLGNGGNIVASTGSSSSSTAAATAAAAPAVSSIEDLTSYGTVIQILQADGMLAGAQIKLAKDFVAPAGFVIQKQGAEVSSAKAGDTVSIWVPQSLRVKA